MGVEIERKFLVTDQSFKDMAYETRNITQGYLVHANGFSVRIRTTDTEAILTIKGPSSNNGLTRFEFNQVIPMDEARQMLELCSGSLIEKRRYLVKHKGHLFEVDEFFGKNQGLTIAEIELESENEPFEKPAFLGEEVTGISCYYNSYLALKQ